MKRRLIDTNLIVRYLVGDHERHSNIAAALFAACDAGEVTLAILPEVLAECVFVLESFYKHPRAAIAAVLTQLLECPGVDIPECAMHMDALARYAKHKLHFVDCVLAASAAAYGIAVASFDTDFKKMPDVKVEI